MLADVLGAAAGWPLRMVVTSDRDAATMARSAGWSIVPDPGSGLNDAVAEGTSATSSAGGTALLGPPLDVPPVTGRGLEALLATQADAGGGRPHDRGARRALRRAP